MALDRVRHENLMGKPSSFGIATGVYNSIADIVGDKMSSKALLI